MAVAVAEVHNLVELEAKVVSVVEATAVIV
jgi:hypothetical protein